MSGRQVERVSSVMMDSALERESHERTKAEIRAIFAGLDRLDEITAEIWDSLD